MKKYTKAMVLDFFMSNYLPPVKEKEAGKKNYKERKEAWDNLLEYLIYKELISVKQAWKWISPYPPICVHAKPRKIMTRIKAITNFRKLYLPKIRAVEKMLLGRPLKGKKYKNYDLRQKRWMEYIQQLQKNQKITKNEILTWSIPNFCLPKSKIWH